MSPDKKSRVPHRSGGRDPRKRAAVESDASAGDREVSAPPDDSPGTTVTEGGEKNPTRPHSDARNSAVGQGLALVGPTSEATRRLVAESRARQGLAPYITDPHTIAALAQFLRNALDSIERDQRRGDR